MIRGAAASREQLLDYQKEFYESALTEAARDTLKAYVFATPGDESRMYHFLDLLTYHRIRVHDLAGEITVNGRTFAAGVAKIVPMSQPQYRMIRVIFERFTEFADPTFYDVSAWTYPLAYDLDYEALSGRNFETSLLGTKLRLRCQRPVFPTGRTTLMHLHGPTITHRERSIAF